MNVIEIKEMAKKGNCLIEESIIDLLKKYPEGLSNSEIAHELELESSHEGSQINYLTYSVLGNLMSKGLVSKVKHGPRCVKFYIN